MSKSHQHEAQNVHSASVCSKVKIAIAISFYLSQACQQESTSKEQEQNEKLNVIWAFRETMNTNYTRKYLPMRVLIEGRGEGDDRG